MGIPVRGCTCSTGRLALQWLDCHLIVLLARKGVGACSDFVGPPTNITGGEPQVPPVLSRCAPSPDRPPPGLSPPLRRLPQTFNNRDILQQVTKITLAQDPKGQSRARSGGRFACKLADATATAPAGRNARYRCHRMPCAASKGPWAARRKSRQAPTLYRSLSRVFRINMQLS